MVWLIVYIAGSMLTSGFFGYDAAKRETIEAAGLVLTAIFWPVIMPAIIGAWIGNKW